MERENKILKKLIKFFALFMIALILLLAIFVVIDAFQIYSFDTPEIVREESTHNHDQIERARNRENVLTQNNK